MTWTQRTVIYKSYSINKEPWNPVNAPRHAYTSVMSVTYIYLTRNKKQLFLMSSPMYLWTLHLLSDSQIMFRDEQAVFLVVVQISMILYYVRWARPGVLQWYSVKLRGAYSLIWSSISSIMSDTACLTAANCSSLSQYWINSKSQCWINMESFLSLWVTYHRNVEIFHLMCSSLECFSWWRWRDINT